VIMECIESIGGELALGSTAGRGSRLEIAIPGTKNSQPEQLLKPERRATALIHEDATSSQANEIEAGLVAGLAYVTRQVIAKELNEGKTTNKTTYSENEFFKFGIGIVTPHKAQKALVGSCWRSVRKIDLHRPSFVAVRIVRRALYNSAGHATRSND
jgi:hypothetical protein